MRLTSVLILAATRLSAQTPWTPEHFWQQKSEYAGARACAGCHADIYRIQESSNHGRSLRPVAEVSEMTGHPPFEIQDRISGAMLSLETGNPGHLSLVARTGTSKEMLDLEWAFGSGAKGITPVGRLRNGEFAESRLSWYQATRGFDFTTGATKFVPRAGSDSLGRPLGKEEILECFACHTTGIAEARAEPARNNMGIRCERCHGPGTEHVRAMSTGRAVNKQIFQPGTLDGFDQAQLCGVCHGRPPQETDFQLIRFIQETPNTVRFPSQRLVLSRCFNETDNGLRCTACHDPHGNVAAARGTFDERCISCHALRAPRRSKVCPVGRDNCASCHMPKQRVMAHSSFTDHWIRVVRDQTAIQ